MINKIIPNPKKSSSKAERISGLVVYQRDPDDGGKCVAYGVSDAFICDADDMPGIIVEMQANAEGSGRSKDPIHHVVLSWPEGEVPTPEQAQEAAAIYMKHCGLENHLYTWALHGNTDNMHLHIVGDRTTPEPHPVTGKHAVKKINNGFTKIAGAEAVALIEQAQGWKSEKNAIVQVLEDGSFARSGSQISKHSETPAVPDVARDNSERAGEMSEIERAQGAVGDLFFTAGSWDDIHEGLRPHGLSFEPKGSGAVIKSGDVIFKASSLSRHASMSKLKKKFGDFTPALSVVEPDVTLSKSVALKEEAIKIASSSINHSEEYFHRLQLFYDYHDAVQADFYRVTAMRTTQDGKKLTMILDKRQGETKGFTPDEVRGRIAEMIRLDERGEHIYFTPLSTNMHHLIVDDMTADSLAEMKAQGFNPAVVLESSSANFQAILNVPHIASDPADRKAANQLVRSLNQELGDPKFTGAIHPHRVPGFLNHKPHHRQPDGSFPSVGLIETAGGICKAAVRRLRDIYDGLKEAVKAKSRATADGQEPGDIVMYGSDLAIYAAHRKDILERLTVAPDLSRVDSMIADRLRVCGFDHERVTGVILDGILGIPGREQKKKYAIDYASRTADHAFNSAFSNRTSKFDKYFAEWEAITEQATAKIVSEDIEGMTL